MVGVLDSFDCGDVFARVVQRQHSRERGSADGAEVRKGREGGRGTLLSDGPVSRGQRSFAPVEAGFGKFLLEWSIELFEQSPGWPLRELSGRGRLLGTSRFRQRR